MFTIDLLKGSGQPNRLKPYELVLICVTVVVPVVATLVLSAIYVNDKITSSILADQLNSWEEMNGKINNNLQDVSKNINWHQNWSPVLVEIVSNVPPSMIITRIELNRQIVKKKITQKDSKRKKEIKFPINSLEIGIAGNSENNYDILVEKFQKSLKKSDRFQNVDNLQVSRSPVRLGKRDVTTYTLNYIFKALEK